MHPNPAHRPPPCLPPDRPNGLATTPAPRSGYFVTLYVHIYIILSVLHHFYGNKLTRRPLEQGGSVHLCVRPTPPPPLETPKTGPVTVTSHYTKSYMMAGSARGVGTGICHSTSDQDKPSVPTEHMPPCHTMGKPAATPSVALLLR